MNNSSMNIFEYFESVYPSEVFWTSPMLIVPDKEIFYFPDD
jgi:hypothetical protein